MYIDFAQPFSLPPFWLNHPVTVLDRKAGSMSAAAAAGNLYQSPLRLKFGSEGEDAWWTLPYDPVMSISGKNTIVRRNVLKNYSDRNERRGTVKELWCLDDYEINIAGVLIGRDGEMPTDDIVKLRKYCEGRESVDVESDLFCLFNICRMSIESFELPFTKGCENQAYTLKGYSDDKFDLLIKE